MTSQDREQIGDELFRFENGLFILGNYSRVQRLIAEKRASESYGKNDYYSLESSNCETFVNFCFTGKAISYQSKFNKSKAVLGDAMIDTTFNLPNDLIKRTGKQCLDLLAQKGTSKCISYNYH